MPVAIPLAPPGKTLEALRTSARDRLRLAAVLLALGTFLLSAAEPLLSVSPAGQVGFLTGIILASLLLVVGLAQAAITEIGFSHAFPLSESADTSRQFFLYSLAAVLPAAAVLAAVYAVVALPGTPLLVLPALPLFWAPVAAGGAVGLVFAARELASERMALLAATGGGLVLAPALSSVVWSLLDPSSVLETGLVPLQLFVIGLGFVAMAVALRADAWVARAGRRTRES